MPKTPDRIALARRPVHQPPGLRPVAGRRHREGSAQTLDPERGADALAGLCRGRLRHVRHGRPLWQRRAHHRPAAGALSRTAKAPARLHQMVPGARADDGRHRAQGRAGAARPARRRKGRPAAVPLVDLRASGLARRAARDGEAEGGGADRRDRRHQFRRRASARWRWPTAFRSPPTRSPSRWSTAAPPATLSDALPREGREAARLRHALRRLPLRQMAGQAGAERHRRLEPLEIQALHRRGRRLGRPSRASWRAAGRDRPTSTASRSPTSRRAGCSSTRRSPPRSSARGSARASTAPTI